jgi:integrase
MGPQARGKKGYQYIDLGYLNGKRIRERVLDKEGKPTTDPEVARRYFDKKMKEKNAAEIGAITYVSNGARRMFITELTAALRADLELRGKLSVQTASHLKRVESDFGDYRASALSPQIIDKYIADRLGDKTDADGKVIPGAKPASVNRTLQLLAQSFALAVRRGTLARAPYIRHLSESGNARQGFFSEQQITDVLAALPNDGLRDFVDWLGASGMRKGEASLLTWSMIDGDTLTIPGTICKNGKPRVLPLGPELKAIIERRKLARRIERDGVVSISEFVFHREGARIAEFRRSWRTATRKANCHGFLAHDLRRSCARRLLAAGIPMPTAQKLTGHLTSSMYQRYAIVDAADMLAAQAKAAKFRKRVVSMR